MFDPLGSSPFAEANVLSPPWPTTPHPPSSPVPNLQRSSSSQPQSPTHTPISPSGSTGPYGREPQIYGQPEAGLISPSTNVGANGAKYEKTEPYLRARITLLDRNRRDILVRFDAQTNLPNFTGSTYRNISRSYAEFQLFHEAIAHNTPQTIVPALPLAQTSAPTDEEDDRLVKIMLQRWMTRVCEDQFLMRDEETRSFIESDFGYQPMPRNPRKKAGSGFSLMKRGVPDEDETLQRARFELTKLEGQFFDAAKAIDKLSRVRKTLSTAQAEMGNKLVNVASTEAHPPLANALRKLGRTWHSISDLDQAASISECVIIGDSMGYQGMNAKSAKETLLQRTSVLEEYQAAVKTTISKRRHIERLKSSSNINPSKVDEAIEDMEEANKYEQILGQRVDGISHNLHLALARHDKLVNDDITAALIEHARSMLSYERQRLRELEALRPDFNSADKRFIPAPLAPKPAFIPKLDDDLKPAPPPVKPASAVHNSSAPATAASFRPPPSGPALPSKSPVPAPLPPQSPGAGPSTPSSPFFPRNGTSAYFKPASSTTDPLGGRPLDGTKSMFITPSATLAAAAAAASSPPTPASPSISSIVSPVARAPLSAGPLSSSSTPAPLVPPVSLPPSKAPTQPIGSSNPATPVASTAVYRETDPLGPLSPHAVGRPAASQSSLASPLGPEIRSAGPSSPSPLGNGHAKQEEIDPLGLAKPKYMSQSMRLPSKPQRPRLDAREAASKLANFF